MDEMGTKIDELEKSINELLKEAEASPEIKKEEKTS